MKPPDGLPRALALSEGDDFDVGAYLTEAARDIDGPNVVSAWRKALARYRAQDAEKP